MSENTICQYVRRKQQRVGLLMAYKDKDKENDRVIIVGAKVNLKAGDRFNPVFARDLTLHRIEATESGRKTHVPASFKHDLVKFAARCRKFFKTDNLVLPEVGQVQVGHVEPASALSVLREWIRNE